MTLVSTGDTSRVPNSGAEACLLQVRCGELAMKPRRRLACRIVAGCTEPLANLGMNLYVIE